MAVKDYFEMFPEDWKEAKLEIQIQREGLDNEFASLKETHAITRALYSIPEKLSAMIGKKLTQEEIALFKEKENARWFANEFPQFRISNKEV